MKDKIRAAREEGYSNQEIVDYLKGHKELGPKVSAALEEGYSPDEIIDYYNPPISKGRSVASAGAKGLVRGVRSIANLADPMKTVLSMITGKPPMEEQIQEQFFKEYLPSKEGFAEDVVEKSAEFLPAMALGGEGFIGNLLRSVLAGTAGATAKKMGFGPKGQTVAEIAATGLPGLTKRITPTKVQKPLVDLARRMGLKEAEIAPALQSAAKQKYLTPIASKSKGVQRKISASKEAIGNIYNTLKKAPAATKPMNQKQAQAFINNIAEVAKSMPMESRKRVLGDAQDLLKTGFSGEGIINFWQDLNYYIPRGERMLGRFKDPLEKGLRSINPQLAEDFVNTNKLFEGISSLSSKMRPKLADQLVKGGTIYKLVNAILDGDFKMIGKMVKYGTGLGAVQKSMSSLLTNPRYQNLFKKSLEALSKNRISIANQLKDRLAKEMKDESPELSEALKSNDF